MTDNLTRQQRISAARPDYQGTTTAALSYDLMRHHIGHRVIDLGAGDGTLVRVLREHGHEAVGFDCHPAGPGVERADITSLPVEPASCDTVVCLATLEHLTEEQHADTLDEAYSALVPGGTLIVSVPDNEVLERNRCGCPECAATFHRYGHLRSYTRESLRATLRAADFKVQSMHVYSIGPMAKIPGGRWLNPLFVRVSYLDRMLYAVARKP